MFEVYKDLKERYPKSIMLIKSGGFYECLCDDCIIINKLLGYKIKRWNKYIRCGFPVASLVKVTSILTKYEINYIIYDKEGINVNRFSHNHYNDYITDYNFDINNENINTQKNYSSKESEQDSLYNIESNNSNNANNIEGLICKISL